jgi:cell division protein FtsQ
MAIKRNIVIKWMLTGVWIAFGAGTIVLLVAAVRVKDAQRCKKIDITIKGVNNIFFVDKNDILDSIISIEGNNPVGNPINTFNLKMIEKKLRKNIWVKNIELFFDNNGILEVKVTEREPVARIFTTGGNTFYIDSAIAMLPLSEKFSARLPVFTDFPSDAKVLSTTDSILLQQVKSISVAIQKDSFCMGLIDQVDITPQRNFEFVPKLGNNIIEFGDANDIDNKLNKLKLFYKKVMPGVGWNYYTVVNVQYKNEVVAKKRGQDDKTADSLRTIQIMQQIAVNAEKEANDSLQTIAPDNDRNTTDENIIQQSFQRDENDDTEAPNTFEKLLQMQSSANAPALPKTAPAVKHEATAEKPKPKAIIVPPKKPVEQKAKVDVVPAKPKPAKPLPAVQAIKPKADTKPAVVSKPKQTTAPKKKTEPDNDY